MYVSQHFIDTVKENSTDLKKLIATDLFTIREPFERPDGAKPKDWNHIKVELICRKFGDLTVYFTYHEDDYIWTLRNGIM